MILFSACPLIDQLLNPNLLVGTWKTSWTGKDPWYFTFNEDMTFQEDMYLLYDEAWESWEHYTGTYEYTDSMLTLLYDGDSEPIVMVYTLDEAILILGAIEDWVILIGFIRAELPIFDDTELVTLTVGQPHNFNGVILTLDSIHWFKYRDQYGIEHNDNRIVFQFTVENTTAGDLSLNYYNSWGRIIETPGRTRLIGWNSMQYGGSSDIDNVDAFYGGTILSTAVIKDACVFPGVSVTATSFVFKGGVPYSNADYTQSDSYGFEVHFDRSDIIDVAIL